MLASSVIRTPAKNLASIGKYSRVSLIANFGQKPRSNRFFSNSIAMSAPATTQIEVLQEGDGKTFPKVGDLVTIHYTGTLENGKKFDSSRDRGKPFQCTIGVGQVIKGWDTGIPKLSLGSRSKLTIPGHEAYGDRGFPGLIPPQATLIFDVELIGIN